VFSSGLLLVSVKVTLIVVTDQCDGTVFMSAKNIYTHFTSLYTTSFSHCTTSSTHNITTISYHTASPPSLAEERMADRLAHFITEEDLREIKVNIR
jgi:hypothetical protein